MRALLRRGHAVKIAAQDRALYIVQLRTDNQIQITMLHSGLAERAAIKIYRSSRGAREVRRETILAGKSS